VKNENYNLIKLLHNKLDDVWRIEKHYRDDAVCEGCRELLDKILEADRQNVELLVAELRKHAEQGLD
jgi:hypothetical protein